MDETQTDFEKRYNDQQRYVKELEAAKKQYEEDWALLSSDPRYKPAYEHIQKVAKGETATEQPKQAEPEGPPGWFKEWQEKEYRPLRSDYESRQQKARREWNEKVEAREKELGEAHPELVMQNWFGPMDRDNPEKGKLTRWMARTGIDDIEQAIRANLDPKYWYQSESEKSDKPRPKKEPSERPVEGKPTSREEPVAVNAEQAINRARARFREDSRVAG